MLDANGQFSGVEIHSSEVIDWTSNFELIAQSDVSPEIACVQAMKLSSSSRILYTSQFHPEVYNLYAGNGKDYLVNFLRMVLGTKE